jgi:hypothetical protein
VLRCLWHELREIENGSLQRRAGAIAARRFAYVLTSRGICTNYYL